MSKAIIRSEIPGTVWKIEASVNDALEEDDSVMLLESMKMEIPVLMPEDGKILRILVAEGDVISEGQELVEIELP